MTKHPMQPVEIPPGQDTRPRFKQNAVVRYLLDLCKQKGICDMNALGDIHFDPDDRQHFAQLIGYTVDGYAELDYHDPAVVNKADDKVKALRRRRAKKK